MKFLKFKNGSSVCTHAVVAVRACLAAGTPHVRDRVVVDYVVAGKAASIVEYCSTPEEASTLAACITLECEDTRDVYVLEEDEVYLSSCLDYIALKHPNHDRKGCSDTDLYNAGKVMLRYRCERCESLSQLNAWKSRRGIR